MPIATDHTGKKYGRLVVIGRGEDRVYSDNQKYITWNCLCECGEIAFVISGHLKSGKTRSCGCLRYETYVENGRNGKARLKHGHTTHVNGKYMPSPEYSIWSAMKQRCHNPKNQSFKNYGGRGIEVCSRWRNSFVAFIADMGRRPSLKLSIHRINNDGNYEPGNCKWATLKEQARNSRRFAAKVNAISK